MRQRRTRFGCRVGFAALRLTYIATWAGFAYVAFVSFEAVEYATLEWVDWFNHRRLIEPIGNIPPAEAEHKYFAAADNIDMAACHNPKPPANPGRFSVNVSF